MMKRIVFSIVLWLFMVNFSYAADVWSLGRFDDSYMEFALARNIADYAKTFPDDPVVEIGTVHVEQDIPWILPGCFDTWAGAKNHTLTIDFDLDADDFGDDVAFYEIVFSGVSHWGRPQTLVLKLNDEERRIPTQRGCESDAVLRDPGRGRYTEYREVFLKKSLKAKNNRLTITNADGCWFLWDAIRCSTGSDHIDALTLRTEQTLLKGEPAKREIFLGFDAAALTKPTWISIAVAQSGEPEENHRFLLEPGKYLVGGVIEVPIRNVQKKAEVQATLHTGQEKEPTSHILLDPVRHWEIHLLHQTHLDIGYTDTQVNVLERQVQNIHDALDYIEETSSYPEESQFKFHLEGMWAVEEFFRRADDRDRVRFVNAARSRHLFLDGMYAQAMTGMYNEEELFNVMTTALEFAEKHSILIDSAMSTDVPGWTWGLVPALARQGIKYLNLGPNPGYCGNIYDMADRPFYWESPSGNEHVLALILSTSYNTFHGTIRGTPLEVSSKILPHLDQLLDREHPYDLVVMRYAIEGDNGPPNRIVSDSIKDWNVRYEWPKLILSRNSDAMKAFEERYGDQFPTVRGDLTPYWEDGSASTAAATALNREAVERLLQAETLWTILRPGEYPKERLKNAWTDAIMYDEHTWGAHNSGPEPDSPFVIQQDNFKQDYARRAHLAANELLEQAAEKILDKECDGTFAVFNTTSWERSGFVTLPTNGKERTPNTVLFTNHDDGKDVVGQYLIEGGCVIPMASVSSFDAVMVSEKFHQKTDHSDIPFTIDEEEAIFSNGIITFHIDKKSGSILSLKRHGFEDELVNCDADGCVGLNEYLYILGRIPKEKRYRHDAGVKITVDDIGPWVLTVRVESSAPHCRSLIRKYRIFADSNFIEITNTFDKIRERRPEGVFFVFPFCVDDPVWRYDIPWVVAQVEKDQLPIANRDFYCIQRFCNLNGKQKERKINIDWVTLDANMIQFPPVFDGGNWRHSIDPDGTLYSWCCNNHWTTNYKADQEGGLTFRYVLRINDGDYDAADSQRFAREVHQPLIVFPVDADMQLQDSLFVIDNPNVIATRLIPLEQNNGIFVRLFNPTPVFQDIRLSLLESSQICLRGEHKQRLKGPSVPLCFKPWEIMELEIMK